MLPSASLPFLYMAKATRWRRAVSGHETEGFRIDGSALLSRNWRGIRKSLAISLLPQ